MHSLEFNSCSAMFADVREGSHVPARTRKPTCPVPDPEFPLA
ncbi:MAG: hypothetical protein RSP_08210 [Rhodanobacter sp.]